MFFAVGLGLPDPPYACIGLSPDTTHPDGRPFFTLDPPMPLDNCYVHTLQNFSARITRMHTGSPSNIHLDLAQQTTVSNTHIKDYFAWSASQPQAPALPPDPAMLEWEARQTYSFSDGAPSSAHDPGSENGLTGGNDSRAGSESGANESQSDDGSDGTTDSDDEPQKAEPRAEIWLDLSNVSDPGTPSDLIKTISRLKEYGLITGRYR